LNFHKGGSWSNAADEMEQAYKIFNRTKIAKYQQAIERVFNTIFENMGYDVELQIVPLSIEAPVDVTSDEGKSEEVSADNVETTSLDSK
jgi:Skp family chaperone for outer membrane proteins